LDIQPNCGGEDTILARGLIHHSHLQEERIQHIKAPLLHTREK
jgi:hypothetical protein